MKRPTMKYIKELGDEIYSNPIDPNGVRQEEQKGPTCWLTGTLNNAQYNVKDNFELNTGIQISARKYRRFLVYCRNVKGVDLEKGGPPLIALDFFLERWNDYLDEAIKLRGYYINSLLDIKQFRKFTKLLSNNIIFGYTRNAGGGFIDDRSDKILDQTNWEDSSLRHYVNLGKDNKTKKLKEYGSYGRNKYNYLWFFYKSFLGLLNNGDVRQSVYFITREDEQQNK